MSNKKSKAKQFFLFCFLLSFVGCSTVDNRIDSTSSSRFDSTTNLLGEISSSDSTSSKDSSSVNSSSQNSSSTTTQTSISSNEQSASISKESSSSSTAQSSSSSTTQSSSTTTSSSSSSSTTTQSSSSSSTQSSSSSNVQTSTSSSTQQSSSSTTTQQSSSSTQSSSSSNVQTSTSSSSSTQQSSSSSTLTSSDVQTSSSSSTSQSSSSSSSSSQDSTTPSVDSSSSSSSPVVTTYVVTFNANGGEFDNKSQSYQIQVNKNETINIDSVKKPTKAGHAFNQWSRVNNGFDYWNFETDVVTSDLDLYATWTPNKYQVNITNENNTAGTVTGNGDYDYGTMVTLTATANDGYHFVGWYQADALKSTDTTYKFALLDSITLVAKWDVNEYTINLDAGAGATVSNSTYKVKYNASYQLPVAVKTGYAFDGWYYQNNKLTDAIGQSILPYTYTSNINVEARFIANKYTYTFKNYDDSIISSTTADYGSTIVYPTNNPTYDDNDYEYTFTGWNPSDLKVLTENVDIKATYSRKLKVHNKVINMLSDSLGNNRAVYMNAVLEGEANLTTDLKFQIDKDVFNSLLHKDELTNEERQNLSIESLLKSATLQASVTYKEDTFYLEVTPTDTYVSVFGKVYTLNLLKTYNTLLQVLPKDVFDVASFLDNFIASDVEAKSATLVEEGNKTTLTAIVRNDYQEGTGEVNGNTNPFYGKDLQCSVIFNKENGIYSIESAELKILYEKITVTTNNGEGFVCDISHDNTLDYFDQLLNFAKAISNTAQMKNFHITGNLDISLLGNKRSTFDVKLSINEKNQVFASIYLSLKCDTLKQLFKNDTDLYLYYDGSKEMLYAKRVTFTTEGVINKKHYQQADYQTWTTEKFKEDIMNNIFWLINASDTVTKNAGSTTMSVDYKNVLSSVATNENTLTITLNKDAITMGGGSISFAITQNIVISVSKTTDDYLDSFGLTTGLGLSGLDAISVNINNTKLVDRGVSLKVDEIIAGLEDKVDIYKDAGLYIGQKVKV